MTRATCLRYGKIRKAIRGAKLKLGAHPLGGCRSGLLGPLSERYGIEITVISDVVDPTFGFMTVDWDGKIRMDCSSPYAMARVIALKEAFDVAFANDTDHDRPGIVTRSAGASFLRRDGTVWTTDKDGILLDLLAAEMMATTGRDRLRGGAPT